METLHLSLPPQGRRLGHFAVRGSTHRKKTPLNTGRQILGEHPVSGQHDQRNQSQHFSIFNYFREFTATSILGSFTQAAVHVMYAHTWGEFNMAHLSLFHSQISLFNKINNEIWLRARGNYLEWQKEHILPSLSRSNKCKIFLTTDQMGLV